MLPKLTSPNQANSFSTHHFASNQTSSLPPFASNWRMLNFQGELPFAPTIRYSLPFPSWLIATPTIRYSLPSSDLPTCRPHDLPIS
jgi:hypothetical protein